MAMNGPEVIVRGRLTAEGTLKLDAQPALPAGPVEVLIRPMSSEGEAGDWWQYLQRARAELEAAGYRFRTKDEIEAEIESLRSGDERIDKPRGASG